MPVISKNTAVVSKYVSVVCPGDCGGTCNSCSSGSLDAASVDYLSELQIRIPDPADISTGGDVSLKADKIIGGTPDNLLVVAPDGENFADSGIPIANVAQVDSDGIVGNLTVLDANKNAVDAGYAASQSASANTVVRRTSDGGIAAIGQFAAGVDGRSIDNSGVYGQSTNGSGVSGYAPTTGTGVTGTSASGTGGQSTSTSGTYHHRFGTKSAIERTTGVLKFVDSTAATDRAAQRTELGLGTAALAATGDFDAAGAAATAQAAAELASLPRQMAQTEISANYTLALTDEASVIASTAGTLVTITVPTNAAVAFPVGAIVDLERRGLGTLAVAAASGVTIRSYQYAQTLSGQWVRARLQKIAADEWMLTGSLSAFNPAEISGLKLWLDANAITGLADGDLIATWTDKSGNARNATAAGAAQPTYKTGIVNSKPTVRFNGTANYMATATTPALAQPNTVFWVGKLSNAWTGDGAFFDSTTALKSMVEVYPLDTKAYQMYADSAINSTTRRITSAYRLYEAVFNGASSSLIADGLTQATGNPGAGGFAGVRIGSRGNGTKFLNGDIAELLVYSGTLTTAQTNLVRSYLKSKYMSAANRIIADGDSLTYGTGSTGGLTFPAQLATLLGRTATNVAVPGKTMTSIRDETATLPYGGLTNDIMVLYVGTADLGSGAPASTIGPILLTAAQRYVAAGLQLVICTLADSQAATNPVDYETQRQTFNSYIRSNAAATGYTVADLAADSRIGDVGDANNTTYFDADKVHMNNTGYGVVAAIVAAALEG